MDVKNFIFQWLIGLVALLILQFFAFLYGYQKKRIDFIDVVWGLSFVLVGVVYLVLNFDNLNLATVVAYVCILVWGLRLSSHIYSRFKKTPVQDLRYTNLTTAYIDKPLVVYVKIFSTQAFLANLVMLVFLAITSSNLANIYSLMVGLAVWIFGFLFESVADKQLKNHIASKVGGLMTTGLWKYSRHPNYFGEVVQWWGIWLMTIGLGWISLVGLVGPVLITFLTVFVSGVPMLEKHMSKKDGWTDYEKSTPIFIPFVKFDK